MRCARLGLGWWLLERQFCRIERAFLPGLAPWRSCDCLATSTPDLGLIGPRLLKVELRASTGTFVRERGLVPVHLTENFLPWMGFPVLTGTSPGPLAWPLRYVAPN